MTESRTEALSGTWAPAQCPFRVAYSLRALDDIRLAVVDAFFSVPHGGVEIGGILLGTRDDLQTTVLSYLPLECEHAFGPSFTPSPKDLARLSALLEEARKNASDLQPVGWYHSHTRSGIFLSEADLEIHKRYFPSPWQVALVMKPHTFQPARAGFFFREADGSFNSQATYLEFVLEPLPLRSTPASAAPPAAAGSSVRPDSPSAARVIAMPPSAAAGPHSGPESVAASAPAVRPPTPLPAPVQISTPPAPAVRSPNPPAPVAQLPAPPAPAVRPPTPPAPVAQLPAPPAPAVRPPTPPAPVAQLPTPPAPASDHQAPAGQPTLHFLDLDPPRRWRVMPLLAVAACLAIGALGFETRQAWLPRLSNLWHSGNTAPARIAIVTSLGLTLSDHNGDLNIAWDHRAAAVRVATSGTVEISSGGGIPMATRLDATQLQSGSLTFKRDTEKVDVVLSVEGPNGVLGRQSLGFLGKLPEPSPEESAELDRLKGEIQALTARNLELQKSQDTHADPAELDHLKSQLTAQIARTRELEKTGKARDDQIAKLRNDLSVQQSHNRVLAKSLDDMQLKMQQMKRLSNQNADPAKP